MLKSLQALQVTSGGPSCNYKTNIGIIMNDILQAW